MENPGITQAQTGDTPKKGKLAGRSLLNAVLLAREEAERAKQTRLETNSSNMDVYLGRMDWSAKIPGQTKQALPKLAVAVEQFSSTLERALVGPTKWFEVEFSPKLDLSVPGAAEMVVALAPRMQPQPEQYLSEEDAKRLLDFFLVDELKTNCQTGRGFPSLFAQACVLAGLESICAFKLQPQPSPAPWRLRVDLIGLEDLYIDPTGEGLYLIHEFEADWHVITRAAEDGLYDKAAVRILTEQRKSNEARRPGTQKGQDEAEPRSYRRRVVITEYYGDLLNVDGSIAHERCRVVLGNHRVVLRAPEPCERWPFVFVRPSAIPFGVLGRGLFDASAELNTAMNECFSLAIDGGIASVWGITQLRRDMLEDPDQCSDGIPQGECLVVNSNLPIGEKVYERVDDGQPPAAALDILAKLDSEFSQSAHSTELALGSLPSKQVRATEAVQLAEQQAAAFTVLGARLERDVLQPVLEMAFDIILENADQLDQRELVDLIGTAKALKLRSTAARTPDILKQAFSPADFKVSGLSALGERSRDFFRLTQLMQVIATAYLPSAQVLATAGIDAEKLLNQIIRSLGLDIERLRLAPSQRTPVPAMPPQAEMAMPAGLPGSQAPAPDMSSPGNVPSGMGA